ncbi:MAG: 50S ribosomal protein L23 [Deltaproteobacteria bacterium]|nr:50S ribosomal protein L23 [Deltaproteobacteria bacterium]
MNPFDVIKRPLITEKLVKQQTTQNQYGFEVDQRATKHDVRQAIESLFQVKVLQVSTLNMLGKQKRVGRTQGKTADWKKAIVTLKAGDKIDFEATKG